MKRVCASFVWNYGGKMKLVRHQTIEYHAKETKIKTNKTIKWTTTIPKSLNFVPLIYDSVGVVFFAWKKSVDFSMLLPFFMSWIILMASIFCGLFAYVNLSARMKNAALFLPSNSLYYALHCARVNFKAFATERKKNACVHCGLQNNRTMHEVMLSTPSIQFDLAYDRQICISGNPKVSVGLHLNWCIGVTIANVHMPIGCIKFKQFPAFALF